MQDTGSPSELYVSVITIVSTVCNSNSVKQLLLNFKKKKQTLSTWSMYKLCLGKSFFLATPLQQ